jgi:hypothetical protein
MKINVTIDLDDIWADENSLNEQIEHHIKREVINEIWNKVKSTVEDQITINIKTEVEKNYTRQIQGFISEFFETGMIKSPRKSNEQISLKDYILYQFEINTGWNSPKEQIGKIAKTYGDEMKNRYDLLFASQLVAKMNEVGLLKEDVVKKLLE